VKMKEKFLAVSEKNAKTPNFNPVPELQDLISQLPAPQRASSELLFNHLKRVCDNTNGEVKPFHLGSCFGGLYRTWFPLILPNCPQVFTGPKKE